MNRRSRRKLIRAQEKVFVKMLAAQTQAMMGPLHPLKTPPPDGDLFSLEAVIRSGLDMLAFAEIAQKQAPNGDGGRQ